VHQRAADPRHHGELAADRDAVIELDGRLPVLGLLVLLPGEEQFEPLLATVAPLRDDRPGDDQVAADRDLRGMEIDERPGKVEHPIGRRRLIGESWDVSRKLEGCRKARLDVRKLRQIRIGEFLRRELIVGFPLPRLFDRDGKDTDEMSYGFRSPVQIHGTGLPNDRMLTLRPFCLGTGPGWPP
jgi:hypothetical protein